LTAIRCAFLVAAHHGVSLAQEDLPALVEGDMTGSVESALARASFRVRVLRRCTWKTASTLGTALPVMLPLRDGATGSSPSCWTRAPRRTARS
jgi:hypothetical protein